MSEFKVILVGNFAVGKTSLIRRFTDGTFHQERMPESFDTLNKVVTINGKQITLKITDTAGGEKFRTLTSSFYRNADAIIITFDLTNAESFEDLEGAHKEADYYAAPACKFICDNKCDLKNERVISVEKAKEMGQKQGLPYIETSALTGEGINELFESVAKKLSGTTAPAKPEGTVDLGKPKKATGEKEHKKTGCNLF